MKTIEYRIVYSEGQVEWVTVGARDINSGFAKALSVAKRPLGSGVVREIARIEFFQVA